MKPAVLQKLKHDKILTKSNFPNFVETFNYTVERTNNIVGDKDLDSQSGIIRVDNTDPEHPVIRCELPPTSGGGGSNYAPPPSAFGIQVVETEDQQGETVRTSTITNCTFYFDGRQYTLADYPAPSSGSVYLNGSRSGSGEGSWTFNLAASPGIALSPTSVSYKLYDFADEAVVCDYRTSALTFTHGPTDYFKVEKSDQSIKGELDAQGTDAKLTLEGASHDVTIDAADATQDNVQLRECTYYAPGHTSTSETVNILASKAITIGPPAKARSYVTDVTFRIENNQLIAKLWKRNAVSDTQTTSEQVVCDLHSLDVVTDTDYTSPNFTEAKQSVTVIGTAPETSPTPQTVFTTSGVDVVTNTNYTNPNFKQTKKNVSVIGNAGQAQETTVFITTPLTSE